MATLAERSVMIRRWLARLVVGLAVIWLVGCGRDQASLQPLKPDARIVAFGNSLTRGTGAPDEASYPAVLSAMIDREVINAGVPGELTDAGRQRLPDVLERTQPDLLLLCHGGNDFLEDRDPKRIKANLRAMIEQARARGVEVLLIGVPDRGITVSTAELYGALADELDMPLMAGVIATIISSRELRSDRVHPNAQGYRRLAEAVRDELVASGALSGP